MSTESLNLFLAGGTVVLALMATVIAFQTLKYMRGRDTEVDTRNGWIEIHKAMVNLRVQRAFVMMQLSQAGAYMQGGPNPYEEAERDYTLASAQLRGQLDRLNDEPLIIELANFLDENKLTAQWQTPGFQSVFDDFSHKVAMKSRPPITQRRKTVRKLVREAVIFCLLGCILTIIGSFVVMERNNRLAAISTAKSAVHAEVELDFSSAVPIPLGATVGAPIHFVKVPLTNGTSLSIRECPALSQNLPPGFKPYDPKYEQEHDCRYFFDAYAKYGGGLDSVPLGNSDQVSVEKEYWTAYKMAKRGKTLEDLMVSGLVGLLYGFPAGFGVWCLYRLVRFAIFG